MSSLQCKSYHQLSRIYVLRIVITSVWITEYSQYWQMQRRQMGPNVLRQGEQFERIYLSQLQHLQATQISKVITLSNNTYLIQKEMYSYIEWCL